MGDMDHRARLFFSVAFLFAAFVSTFITSSTITLTMQEGATFLLPLSPVQQGILVVKIILDCTLVFFTAVFYILATAFGISELRFQLRRFKQAASPRSSSSHPVNSQRPPYQQRRRVQGN